ncbi:MAG: flavin reductase family protein, partial [Bacteroidota bacterium]
IVRQMAVASVEFDTGISEFTKTGLTPIPSDLVKPFRVKESPAQLECKVQDILTLGEHGGAGHLIICKVVRMHIAEDVVDENNRIDPHKMDLMGRMGRAFYVRASGEQVQPIVQAVTKVTIGYDQLPDPIRTSEMLTGNGLGLLAGLLSIPNQEETLQLLEEDEEVQKILQLSNWEVALHRYIHQVLRDPEQREYAGKLAWLASYRADNQS